METLKNLISQLCIVNFAAEAYDALDPTGNITIKWDVMSWTPDGYVVSSMQCIVVHFYIQASAPSNHIHLLPLYFPRWIHWNFGQFTTYPPLLDWTGHCYNV